LSEGEQPVTFKTLREQKMYIDLMQFLTQAVGLVAWVFLAAGVYAAIEKALGGPAQSGGE